MEIKIPNLKRIEMILMLSSLISSLIDNKEKFLEIKEKFFQEDFFEGDSFEGAFLDQELLWAFALMQATEQINIVACLESMLAKALLQESGTPENN